MKPPTILITHVSQQCMELSLASEHLESRFIVSLEMEAKLTCQNRVQRLFKGLLHISRGVSVVFRPGGHHENAHESQNTNGHVKRSSENNQNRTVDTYQLIIMLQFFHVSLCTVLAKSPLIFH